MIKAVCNGGQLILLGLSHQNLDRLRQGKPIKIAGRDLGITGDIVIFSGETEQSMSWELREAISPDTEIHIDSKLKS